MRNESFERDAERLVVPAGVPEGQGLPDGVEPGSEPRLVEGNGVSSPTG